MRGRLLCGVGLVVMLHHISTAVANQDQFDFANGLFLRGMYAMAAGEYLEFIQALPDHPDVPLAQFRRGESLFLSEQYSAALAAFDMLRKDHPDSPQSNRVILRMGQTHYFLKDYDRAETAFVSLQDHPEWGDEAQYFLARLCYDQNQIKRASAWFQKIGDRSRDPRYKAYALYYLGEIAYNQKNFDTAIQYFHNSQKFEPSIDIPELDFVLAKAYFYKGDYKEAQARLARHLHDPEAVFSLEAFEMNLYCHYHLHQYSEGIGFVKQHPAVWQIHPRRHSLTFLLADMYVREGLPWQAIESYASVIDSPQASTKNIHSAKIETAKLLRMQKRYDDALALLDRMDDGAAVRFERARVFEAQKNPSAALSLYAKNMASLEIHDDIYRQSLYQSGYAYATLGEWTSMKSVLLDYLKHYPDDPSVLSIQYDLLALAYHEHAYDTVIQGAKSLIADHPDASDADRAAILLAQAYHGTGMSDKGVRLLETFLKGKPGTDLKRQAWFALGQMYRDQKNYAKAIASYDNIFMQDRFDNLDRDALLQQVFCYIQMKHYDKVAACYQQLIERSPPTDISKDAYVWLAEYYLSEMSFDALKLLLLSWDAQNTQDDAMERYYYHAELSRLQKKYPEAIQLYDQALRSEHKTMLNACYYGKALSLRENHQAKEAMVFFDKAIQENPEDTPIVVPARIEKAYLTKQAGDVLNAAKQFMMVAILYEDEDLVPKSLYEAGELFQQCGQTQDARKAFQEIITDYHTHPLAMDAQKSLDQLR